MSRADTAVGKHAYRALQQHCAPLCLVERMGAPAPDEPPPVMA
jgi:hypothetical protein